MKKAILDLSVKSSERLSAHHQLLRLTHDVALPEMLPGQFVEVRVDGSPNTFLRRPLSIHYYDRVANEVWLLVAGVGDGTKRLMACREGDKINCVLPLGNAFTMPSSLGERLLLVGGGVGVAPLLFFGKVLSEQGHRPAFLLGARTGADLLQADLFSAYGDVYVTTEDGSAGEKGFVTNHSILNSRFSRIACCGPLPMMKAVARYARQTNTDCEVSLENMMACGLGACLCCVEKTVRGNVCVCKEGPVFNYKDLLWQD
ncbi:MAG: dihydroorotate dehydrogenase electron transfer subunit [Prevotella sp.]|nr:dihydroorotate dehydrogenase electron transfer subunit [Prevotella sp.]